MLAAAVTELMLKHGHVSARLARSEEEVILAQDLRARAFGLNGASGQRDSDAFDPVFQHMLIHARDDLVGCYRMRLHPVGQVVHSYAAEFYELAPFVSFGRPMLEIGRFCLAPGQHDPDALRLAWAAITAVVDQAKVGMLFGCSSFEGADATRHAPALSFLAGRIGPAALLPGRTAPEIVPLSGSPEAGDQARAMVGLPPLLRSYLGLGGWVSDHAVVDRDLDTLHVLTVVEVDKIPAARARVLRQIAHLAVG